MDKRGGLIHSVVCFVERLDTESVVRCRVVHSERKTGRDREKSYSLAIVKFPSFYDVILDCTESLGAGFSSRSDIHGLWLLESWERVDVGWVVEE